MSTLDDALSSPSPVFGDPTLNVDWLETMANEGDGPENLRNLSDTLTGAFEVAQSFDDGLPDAVTMTNSADAAGKMDASVLGRQGLTYSNWVVSATASGTIAGPTNQLNPSAFTNYAPDTYVFVFLTLPSITATLTQTRADNTPYAWTFVGKQSSATVTTWVYMRKSNNETYALPFFNCSETLSNVTYVTAAVRAFDPAGNGLRWRVNAQVAGVAGGVATAHTQPSITTTSTRAVFLSVWSSPGSGTWTLTSPDTTLASPSNATTSMLVSRTGLYTNETTRNNLIATRSAGSSDVAMITIAIEPWERPTMVPTEFWSPFYRDSPVLGFDRDTAPVEMGVTTITEDGPQNTVLFTGQMEDVSLESGGDVALSASSRVRITLAKSVNLPTVFGRRESANVDWLMAWIIARGDRFIGPAPGPYARWWVPCYGSLHAALGAESKGYNFQQVWTPATVSNPYGVNYPEEIEGPYHTAIYACHQQNLCIETYLNAIDLYKSTEGWPYVDEIYPPLNVNRELMSFANNKGRASFWVRADATYAGTPTNVPAGNRYLWSFLLESRDRGNGLMGRAWAYMDTDRQVYLQMGSTTGGVSTVTFGGSIALPNDGLWHFYVVSWDYQAGTMKIQRNGNTGSTSQFATNGNNSTNQWTMNTDYDLYNRAGGKIRAIMQSHLPLSDFMLETGPEVYASNADIWPMQQWPSFTATTRPTYTPMEGVFDDSPVIAWDTFAALARSTMSMYRANEADEIEFLPPSYFGETAQMTPAYIVDTEVNAQDLAITADPSKSRNVVTVKFTEQNVDNDYAQCLGITSMVEIPSGVTDITFSLDSPIAEMHGASDPYGAYWTVVNLTSSQITTGWIGTPPDYPFMTVNRLPDGSGTVFSSASVSAKITDATSTSVTLRFINSTGSTAYLANNNQAPDGQNQLPALRLLGYIVRSADAYVTQRDAGVIGTRRERAMDTEVDWLTSRDTAVQLASWLVSTVSRPRPQINVVVQGDPRRIPGDLVTLVDNFNTHAEGNWRVLSVTHSGDGAGFTQLLRLVQDFPMGTWDDSTWDDIIWGE